ncbi:alcohol dehydrogenase catalytic domain-containing protein [Pseudofrankia asymbiotica]|uniref:Enoyl reductase (ER) domain-containing protein n=1 Tax=Pseudofrankia asymbiotica TaxID=1834516 RepID=A0A1V2HZ17_9ACTN|nr:alcohol dehydrogenase catalytic domain-containing protein [Pseudofrankia asymbiotica]ONH21863.1 hypothetical protein BL253_37565 [Pseudofrankia asymbiotica]
MRAYRVTSPGRSELVDCPLPPLGSGEVLLRVRAVGLCHSDVFIRQAPPALRQTLPVTLGHEVVGVVERTAPDVTGWRPGASAAVYMLVGCGRCAACARGEDNLCRNGYRGIGTHLDGGLADFVAVPAANLVGAGGIDPVLAAPLTDAGLTAYHAVSSALPLPRSWHVGLVVGIGGLGHLAVQILAAARSGARLIAVDVDPAKLDLARRLGATDTVLAGDDTTARVVDLVGGRDVDAVLDFVGADATMALAAGVTNRGSAIVVAGLGGGSMPFEASPVTRVSPEVTLRRVSTGSREDLGRVLDLARAGGLRAETVRYPLEKVGEALAALEAGTVLGRAVITIS